MNTRSCRRLGECISEESPYPMACFTIRPVKEVPARESMRIRINLNFEVRITYPRQISLCSYSTGAKTLRSLMQMHERVRERRRIEAFKPPMERVTRSINAAILPPDEEYRYTLSGRVRKELMDALHWAELDGDTARTAGVIPSNIQILEMEDEDRLEIDLHIQNGMLRQAGRWRDILKVFPEDQRPPIPTLFAFVIYKHLLFIVTLDGNKEDAVCHVSIQLNLSEKNQSQWNALAIMVTICWARDLFADLIRVLSGPGGATSGAKPGEEDSDPDA